MLGCRVAAFLRLLHLPPVFGRQILYGEQTSATNTPNLTVAVRSISIALQQRLAQATAVAESAMPNFGAEIGHVGQVPTEVTILRSLANASGVRTVCEIGFAGGHSAVVWLDGLTTRTFEFDLLALRYSNASRAFIEETYPGRVRFHPGNSAITVPAFSREMALAREACDLWFVDGAHGFQWPRQDMLAALSVLRHGGMLVADDCTPRFHRVQEAWRMLVRERLVNEWSDLCQTQTLPAPVGLKGWCVGQFNASVCDHAAPPRICRVLERIRRDGAAPSKHRGLKEKKRG
tara:strand:+ start:370 stop:1239 length:870 start_codon:yes stop_codon:yes gene_type:complete